MKKFLLGVIIAFVSLSCGGRDANSQEKVDPLSICDDKDVTSSTEPPQFDNDSTISESPNPIEAITKRKRRDGYLFHKEQELIIINSLNPCRDWNMGRTTASKTIKNWRIIQNN